MKASNIRNYSIFLDAGTLFAYFEYFGSDYKADMLKMAADPKMQQWWAGHHESNAGAARNTRKESGGPHWKKSSIPTNFS